MRFINTRHAAWVWIFFAGAAGWRCPSVAAEPCGSNGLEETLIGPSIDGIDFTVYYSDDDWLACGEVGEYIPYNLAQLIGEFISDGYDRHHTDWGFDTPWLSTLPDWGVSVFACGSGGWYTGNCVYIDSTRHRCASTMSTFWAVSHEIFHGVQKRYVVNAGVDSTGYGAWYGEGTARCMDDRYNSSLDASGPHLSEVTRLMESGDDELGNWRDLSLTQLSYRSSLWWSYCCERLGARQFEPDNGADFIRELWENCEEDLAAGIKDGIGSADRTIAELGGGSMRALFHDYATCLYTREFDVAALPNSPRYFFIDETPTGRSGGDRYANLTPSVALDGSVSPSDVVFDIVPAYGQRLIEVNNIPPPASSGCEIIGFGGGSVDNIGWSLTGVKAPAAEDLPQRATNLSKRVSNPYIRGFLHTADSPFTRLGLMVSGFDESEVFGTRFAKGPATVSIVRPTADKPAYPGTHDEPGRILVRVHVTGPDELKPFEEATVSVAGLTKHDFGAKIGWLDATILTAGYVGGEYWLVIQAPEQAADAAYDLTIELCPTATFPPTSVSVGSVLYGPYTVNHMLVMDRSGSMAYPDDGSGSKLDAAKNAASLYIDSVNQTDRVGFTWLWGNGFECDDDAITPTPLAVANAAQRAAARNAVLGLIPAGATSIGDGLWKAQDQLDAVPPGAFEIKNIVLLSDGAENEARYWDAVMACPGNLGDPARGRIEPTDTMINAIAFGPEANQSLMQSMKIQTDGDFSYVDVTEGGARNAGLSEVSTLADAYMKHLQNARKLERIFFQSGNAAGGLQLEMSMSLGEGGVEQGTLFVNWPAGAGAVSVELRDPANRLIGPSRARIYTTSTHKVYHLNGTPATGTWTVRMTPTNDTEFIAGLLGRQRKGAQLIAEVSQYRTGGAGGGGNHGAFEHGVPVIVMAMPTDSVGALDDLVINAVITRPDGSTACGNLVLRDDGTQEDGEPNDGVYAAVFTDTSQAGSAAGVHNDNPGDPNPGGPRGTYRAHLKATGVSNMAEPFTRSADVYFHVYSQTGNDTDGDGLPDTWEKFYKTTIGANDAAIDLDGDGLSNQREFENGTNPRAQDTDHGGETDGSELGYGRCPLDPSDDLFPCPIDVGVISDPGDHGDIELVPLANILRFPVYPGYAKMRIFRADESNPSSFALIAEPAIAGPADGTYTDTGLVDGRKYFYRFQAVGDEGATSCVSQTVQGTARLHPMPPVGSVTINTDSERTDSTKVLVTLDLNTTANKFRISNAPIDGTEPLLDLPASPHFTWIMTAPPAGRRWTQVFVQYVDTAAGTASEKYEARVLFDPAGDFDGDTVANSADADDDGDGLPDFDEIFLWQTDAYKPDSDGDGLSDGDEVAGGCTHPRNPDSDGDGTLDGSDPSPSGDGDADGDVDLFDVSKFQACFTGEGNGPVSAGCTCLDADGDDDIDLADYEAFSAGLVGP